MMMEVILHQYRNFIICFSQPMLAILDLPKGGFMMHTGTLKPKTEILSEKNKIKINIDLPGVDAGHIKLHVGVGKLIVDTSRSMRKYMREVQLPVRLNLDSAVALYKNGLLTVTINRSTGAVKVKGARGKRGAGAIECKSNQVRPINITAVPDAEFVAEKNKFESQINALNKELESKEKTVEEFRQKLIRFQEEYVRFKRMTELEKEDYMARCKDELIQKLLEVKDNFERALESAKHTDDKKSLIAGVEMINSQLLKILKDEGIREIETDGKMLDPQLHEVLAREETDKYPDNMIIETMQKGYMLKDRVIRHAKVKVASPISKEVA
jgi:molecular chaperone GrpE